MMTRFKILATLAAAGLSAGGATVVSADDGDQAKAPPAGEFTQIPRYAISYDTTRDVAEFYLREYGIEGKGAKFDEFDHPSDPRMRVMLVTVDGIADDAVQGVQWRLGMRVSQGNWEAVEAGMRRKCYRGETAGEWTRKACP